MARHFHRRESLPLISLISASGRGLWGFCPAMSPRKIWAPAVASGFSAWSGAPFAIPLAAYFGLAASVMAGLAVGALRRRPDPCSGLNWAMALGTGGAVLRLTPLSVVFRLPRRSADRRTMVAGMVAHARGCPALLGSQDRQSRLGWVHSVRRLWSYSAPSISPGELFPNKRSGARRANDCAT